MTAPAPTTPQVSTQTGVTNTQPAVTYGSAAALLIAILEAVLTQLPLFTGNTQAIVLAAVPAVITLGTAYLVRQKVFSPATVESIMQDVEAEFSILQQALAQASGQGFTVETLQTILQGMPAQVAQILGEHTEQVAASFGQAVNAQLSSQVQAAVTDHVGGIAATQTIPAVAPTLADPPATGAWHVYESDPLDPATPVNGPAPVQQPAITQTAAYNPLFDPGSGYHRQ